MLRDDVLALLRSAEGRYKSGEAMSQALGVSRAAIWKAVSSLREAGYQISSASNRGYRLDDAPDLLEPSALSALLPPGCVMGSHLVCLDTVDSTSNECKRLAAGGATEGTVVIAHRQTGGRGRSGRSFLSPPGGGLYLSALFRPDAPPMDAVMLTAWVAVAVCDAVEELCNLRPGIKWSNDIILSGKKLCGILTEMSLEGESGRLDYVVAGIGVNLRSGLSGLDPALSQKAIALEDALGAPPRRDAMAACLLRSLERMRQAFPREKAAWLERYRKDCITLGKQVSVLRPGAEPQVGRAVSVDDQFRLLVDFGAGPQPVEAGEVSVRGLLGYT